MSETIQMSGKDRRQYFVSHVTTSHKVFCYADCAAILDCLENDR